MHFFRVSIANIGRPEKKNSEQLNERVHDTPLGFTPKTGINEKWATIKEPMVPLPSRKGAPRNETNKLLLNYLFPKIAHLQKEPIAHFLFFKERISFLRKNYTTNVDTIQDVKVDNFNFLHLFRRFQNEYF